MVRFKSIKAGILGGLVLFIWSAISWMVLPWHSATIHSFTVEKAVTQSIKSNAPISGIYLSPSMYHQDAATASEDQTAEPMVFTVVSLEGMHHSMFVPLITSLITQLVAAFLVAWLLMKTTGLSYSGRVSFVVVFALAAGIVTHVPYWNWFGFDLQYSLVQMTDLVIGWFLAGLVLARICNGKKH